MYVLCELRKHTFTTITGEQHLHSNTCNGESATTQRTRNGLCLLPSLPLNGVHTGVTAANRGYACVCVCVCVCCVCVLIHAGGELWTLEEHKYDISNTTFILHIDTDANW